MSYTIGVIGTGYVGLVTGACLADVGNTVICVDIDEKKLERLRAGETVIYERSLDQILERNLREQRISFTSNLAEAVQKCSILMLCLPTPPGMDGAADLRAILSAAASIAELVKKVRSGDPLIVVNKSTVPVGTAHRVQAVFAEHLTDEEVIVVSNPEFLREGFAVEDFMRPDRVVIGTDNAYAQGVMEDLYRPFVKAGAPIYIFDIASAEVTKYAANSFLATKISFMNDLSEYCEVVGADIESVRLGIGADNRIGRRFLFAGIGYGGSCFPKDVKAIVQSARNVGVQLEIIESVQAVNKRQIERFCERISKRFNNNLKGKVFGLWGLSFKPNTDDVRDAPAFEIIRYLLQHGATVKAYDPEAQETARRVLGDVVEYMQSMYDAVAQVDALVLATEWNEFRNPDFRRMRELMMHPILFDGRNTYTLEEMIAEGFEYHSIGRASVVPPEPDNEADASF